jgi:hypothetical protein
MPLRRMRAKDEAAVSTRMLSWGKIYQCFVFAWHLRGLIKAQKQHISCGGRGDSVLPTQMTPLLVRGHSIHRHSTPL